MRMRPPSLRKTLIFQTTFGFLSLFFPFVFMKIGPEGYLNYGPHVPDIYIFGGYILGKDVSWWGINFAYKFQLALITVGILIAILCYVMRQNLKLVMVLECILTCLLLLFP